MPIHGKQSEKMAAAGPTELQLELNKFWEKLRGTWLILNIHCVLYCSFGWSATTGRVAFKRCAPYRRAPPPTWWWDSDSHTSCIWCVGQCPGSIILAAAHYAQLHMYAAPPSRASHGMIKHINSVTCTFSLPLSYLTHERRPCRCTPAKKQYKTIALLFVEALKKTGGTWISIHQCFYEWQSSI